VRQRTIVFLVAASNWARKAPCGTRQAGGRQKIQLATLTIMPFRLLACFVAFALFWSGLSTFEAPSTMTQPSPDQQHARALGGTPADLDDGSVDDHHLDDLPSQAQSDPSAETPGMLSAPLMPTSQIQAATQRHGFVAAATGSPFLAGPLRPPCSEALAG
jgi:hypothetical protein